jgi:hypothetical protein
MSTLTRVAVTARATLTHVFVVGDTPTDVTSGTVGVVVTDANGVVATAGTATATGTGTYVFAFPAQAQVNMFSVAWTGTFSGNAVTETDFVEVVGGFYFTLAEARASDPTLDDITKYPTSTLVQKQIEVEQELDRICDRAFAVRYRRVVLDGSATTTLLLPDGGDDLSAGIVMRGVRTVRSAAVADPRLGGPFVPLTTSQLAALTVSTDGQLVRTDGNVWSEGVNNVVVEYEYGSDCCPADLKDAALLRLRDLLNLHRQGIPDDASSYSNSEGNFRRSTPDAYRTGNVYVDAVYSRYSRSPEAGTGNQPRGPAARVLQYDAQRWSLFHLRRGTW